MTRTVLYRCHRCDMAFNPLREPHTADGFGWVCTRCLTNDEVERLR